MTNRDEEGRMAADEVFDAEADRRALRAAVPEDGFARTVFLGRLAARAAVRVAEISDADAGPVPPDVVASMRAAYARERDARQPTAVDLGAAAPWLAARDAFHDDMEFIMKVIGRRVTTPTARFMRYAADALGADLAAVRLYFSAPGGLAFAAVERKSSRKGAPPRVEDFADAVRGSAVPEELKALWLAE